MINCADIAQDPRAQSDRIERHPVAAQGGFSLGATNDVVPVIVVQLLPRFSNDLVQGHKWRIAGCNNYIFGVGLSWG